MTVWSNWISCICFLCSCKYIGNRDKTDWHEVKMVIINMMISIADLLKWSITVDQVLVDIYHDMLFIIQKKMYTVICPCNDKARLGFSRLGQLTNCEFIIIHSIPFFLRIVSNHEIKNPMNICPHMYICIDFSRGIHESTKIQFFFTLLFFAASNCHCQIFVGNNKTKKLNARYQEIFLLFFSL